MDTPSASESVELNKRTWRSVRDQPAEVAVLPWGATEAHNFHLPYGTDNIQVEYVAERAAAGAVQKGAPVVVLPNIPFGVNTQQLDIELTINMNPSTQALVLADVVSSLEGSAVRKLVILNGHGGNHFRQTVRELQARATLFLCVVDWYNIVAQEAFFEERGDHAGEMETSVMMYIAPDLVRPLKEAGKGEAKQFRLQGLRDGTAWAPRRWTSVTEDTGVGNPSRATPEKGAAYLEAVTIRIADFLVDLSLTDPDDLYE